MFFLNDGLKKIMFFIKITNVFFLLCITIYLCLMCQCGLHTLLLSHIRALMLLLTAEPHSTAGFLFPGQYLCRMILVTMYSMVFDWWVSRAGPMPFYWPHCSLPFCFLLFSLSLLSFYGLVLCDWGLWTDRVLITFSQPCIAKFF